jgi:putative spermidine/putrescine transport system substrate-binding protein
MSDIESGTIQEPRRLRRRTVLAGIAASPLLAAPSIARAAESFTVRDAGGAYTAAFTETLYKPFTQETGIEVVSVTSAADPTAQVKAIVDTKNYVWDLVLISGAAHDQLRDLDCLEKLNVDDDPNVKKIKSQFRGPYIVGEEIYATVLAYNTDKYGAHPPTGGWKDFWDVARFPGRRALRKHPFDTCEIALMADGVSQDKVYPIDADRAFKSLDKIKPNINVWYSSGAEAVQAMTSHEVDMNSTWHAGARAAIRGGAPIAISWNQGLYQLSGWSIPKGTPKADLARKFIKFASRTDRQVAYTNILAGGPTNEEVTAQLDPAFAKLLPSYPDNFSQLLQIDNSSLSKVKDQLTERFLTWVVKA